MKMVNTLKRNKLILAAILVLLSASFSFGAKQNTYTTKAAPVGADKALIADSADSNKTKQAALNTMRAALGLDTTDNPSWLSVHASGGNLAANNRQVTKAWQTGLGYTANLTSVIYGGKHYICTSSHTAGSTTEPGVGASWATVWSEVSGAGDDLGSASYSDVVGLWTTCTGYLKSDGSCDTPSGSATYPGSAGVANWNGSAWGTSYTVGTGASNLVQLNVSSQLPAVSAALLTNFPTLNQNTTGTAAGLTSQYINWSSSSGGASIANKPTLGTAAALDHGTDIGDLMRFTDAGTCSNPSYTTEATCESNSGTWTAALGVPFTLPSKADASCFASESAFNACFDLTWATGGYTNLTSFIAQTNWRVFYSNGSGDVTELALGAAGTVLKSNGASAAPTWEADNTAAGAGYVSTPPTYSDEACTAGQYSLDESYRYDCIASGNWNRTSLTDWSNPTPATPTLSARVIGTNGTSLTLTGSASLSVGAGGNGGFDVDCSTAGNGITATYASGAPGTDLVYTLGTTVNSGDTCDLDYTQPGNGIEATTGGSDLASITSGAITNNSTQTASAFLINQNFEGTGYDNSETWAEAGTPDENYTATILRGSQSFYAASGANNSVFTLPVGEGELWAHVTYRITGTFTTDSVQILQFQDSSDAQLALVGVQDTGYNPRFWQTGGSGTSLGVIATTGNTYHLWVHVVKGATSTVEVWHGTTTTRPASTGDNYATATGTWNVDVAKIRIGQGVSSGAGVIIDQVIVDDESFTTVDE